MDPVTCIMNMVNSVLDTISRIWGFVAPHVRYITELKQNVGSLRNAMKELRDISNDYETKVDVLERQGLTRTNELKGWLELVNATELDVKKMEDALDQKTTFLGDCSPNCCSSYSLSKRAVEKLSYVVKLKERGVFKTLAEKSAPDAVTAMPSTVVVGMNSTMEMVQRYIGKDGVGIIGIYGMGGIGKTTLLREINNGFLQRSHSFDVVISAVVSQQVDVIKIQSDVGEGLGLSLPGDQQGRAKTIFDFLRKKNFVLLLDDLWAVLDLEKVGIPDPNIQKRSKVIFTTRFAEVCGEMDAKKIKVECLAWKEAWELFRSKVDEEVLDSDPEIQKLAETVAKECNGLPLALVTIGRAMASKTTPQEWNHAITVLQKSTSAFPGMKDKVLSKLKLSYDNLSDDTMRNCFLYCSLFPEDYIIEKEKLIDYWIGEGIIDINECDEIDEARYKGHDLIGRLKLACLLEDGVDGEKEVKMHDIIRDLALWITTECWEASGKFLVQAGVGLTKAPILGKWKEAKRISLMKNQLNELIESPECPNLLTLMLLWNIKLTKISYSFLKFMPLLKVLDLSYTPLEELPTGIGGLVNLQHLNLSLTLIVTLPEELVNLVNLRHLDLSYTWALAIIPHGVIARLLRLKVLNLHDSYMYWKVDGTNGAESWVDLSEIEGLKELNEVGIRIFDSSTLNAFLGSQILTKCARDLKIDVCSELLSFKLSSTFGNMERLQTLYFTNCRRLEDLIIDAECGNPLLERLNNLTIISSPNLKTILVSPGCLRNLRLIYIRGCSGLKNLTWVLHLPNLQVLRLFDSYGVEELIEGDGEVEESSQYLIPLKKLIRINLSNLPNLMSICNHSLSFPSLRKLDVDSCPKLKKLPFGPNSVNNTLPLRKICGEKEWWDGLEWRDESIKSALLPYFIER